MTVIVEGKEDKPLYHAQYICKHGYALVGLEKRICNPKTDFYQDGWVTRNQYSGKDPSCKGRNHNNIT